MECKTGTLKRGEFGNVDEGDMKSLIAKRTALSVGPSVVGLTSRAGMLVFLIIQ